jgi:hypothetical protein
VISPYLMKWIMGANDGHRCFKNGVAGAIEFFHGELEFLPGASG